jgi:hypothetical protein
LAAFSKSPRQYSGEHPACQQLSKFSPKLNSHRMSVNAFATADAALSFRTFAVRNCDYGLTVASDLQNDLSSSVM